MIISNSKYKNILAYTALSVCIAGIVMCIITIVVGQMDDIRYYTLRSIVRGDIYSLVLRVCVYTVFAAIWLCSSNSRVAKHAKWIYILLMGSLVIGIGLDALAHRDSDVVARGALITREAYSYIYNVVLFIGILGLLARTGIRSRVAIVCYYIPVLIERLFYLVVLVLNNGNSLIISPATVWGFGNRMVTIRAIGYCIALVMTAKLIDDRYHILGTKNNKSKVENTE